MDEALVERGEPLLVYGQPPSAAAAEVTVAQEWARGWPLVLTCALGVGAATFLTYAIGQFMAPLQAAFGWSRTESAAGLTLILVVGVIISPFVGRAIDVMNARWIVLPGLLLSGLAIAALSLANGQALQWLALWFVLALVYQLIAATAWVAVVSQAFSRSRSLAMAATLGGSAFAAIVTPILARSLIDATGWRTAFQLMGLIWCGSTLLLALFFFFDRRPKRTKAAPEAVALPHQNLREVFLSSAFVKLAFVVFVVMAACTAQAIHLAPALAEGGFTATDAAKIVGIMGIAALLGKLSVGWAFDRAPLRLVASVDVAVLGISYLVLTVVHGHLALALAGAFGVGFAGGGTYLVMACVTAKLYRPESFGVVFGALTSCMSLGSAMGPLVVSTLYDRFHGYTVSYWVGFGGTVLALLVLQTLRQPAPQPAS